MSAPEMFVVRHLPTMKVKRVHVLPIGRFAYAERIENVRRYDGKLDQLLVYTDRLENAFVYASKEQAQFDVERYGLGEVLSLADLCATQKDI